MIPCKLCEWQAQTPDALAAHVAKRHVEELKPPAPAPVALATNGGAVQRVAIYLRVSTVDQDPDGQLPRVTQFCGARGWVVVKQYVDWASGKDMNRPALQQLLLDAARADRPFDAVVYRRLSRLGRSLRDNLTLWDYFTGLKVHTISAEEPYDTTTPSGRLVRNVMASVNEYQREEMLDQVYEGLANARAKGKKPGRHPAGCGILFKCAWGTDHSPAAVAARERKRREMRARRGERGPLPLQATHPDGLLQERALRLAAEAPEPIMPPPVASPPPTTGGLSPGKPPEETRGR